MIRRVLIRPSLVLLLAAASGCTVPADRPDAPAVSGAYATGSGGWHS